MPLQRITTVQPPAPDTSEAGKYGALRDALVGFTSDLTDDYARNVGQDAYKAGLQAGLEGPPIVKAGRDIASREFNRGAAVSYGAAIKIETRAKMREFAAQVAAMPPDQRLAEFDSLADGYRSGTMEGLPAELKPDIGLHIDAEFTQIRAGIFDVATAAMHEQNKAAGLRELADLQGEIAAAARDDNSALLNSRLMEFDETLQLQVHAGLVTEAQAATMNDDAESAALVQIHVGRMDKAYDGNTHLDYLEDLIAHRPDGMTVEDHEAAVQAAAAHMSRRARLDSLQASQEAAGREAMQEQANATAFLALTDGDLELQDIRRMVATGEMSAADGYQWTGRLAQMAGGPVFSDPDTLLIYTADLPDLDMDDLLAEPLLSREDKQALVRELRNLPDWQNWEVTREARRRIKGEVGIADGGLVGQGMTDEVKASTRALSELYDRMAALETDVERREQALDIAADVIKTTLGEHIRNGIADIQRRVDRYREELALTEGKAQRQEIEDAIAALERRIEAEREKLR